MAKKQMTLKKLEAMQAAGEQIDWSEMEAQAWQDMTKFSREIARRRNLTGQDIDLGGKVTYLGFKADGTVNDQCTDTEPDFIDIPAENLGRDPHEEALEAANRIKLAPTRNPLKCNNWKWHKTPFLKVDEISDEDVFADTFDYGCEPTHQQQWYDDSAELDAYQDMIAYQFGCGPKHTPNFDPLVRMAGAWTTEDTLQAEQDAKVERERVQLLHDRYDNHDRHGETLYQWRNTMNPEHINPETGACKWDDTKQEFENFWQNDHRFYCGRQWQRNRPGWCRVSGKRTRPFMGTSDGDVQKVFDQRIAKLDRESDAAAFGQDLAEALEICNELIEQARKPRQLEAAA